MQQSVVGMVEQLSPCIQLPPWLRNRRLLGAQMLHWKSGYVRDEGGLRMSVGAARAVYVDA